MECEVCGGHAEILGVLGSRAHFCCRGCGLECSELVPQFEEHALEMSDLDAAGE